MQELRKPIIVGAIVGALAAGMLALPSLLPAAMADEEPVATLLKSSHEIFRKPVDGRDFVKPDWTIEPWVATEPLSERTVKKIGYGRTEYVSIVTTATGTYSSDGLASPRIRYPGIHEHRTLDDVEPFIAIWDGKRWVAIAAGEADSIASALPL